MIATTTARLRSKTLCLSIPENEVNQRDKERGEPDRCDSTINNGLRPFRTDLRNDAHHTHDAAANPGGQGDDKKEADQGMNVLAEGLQGRFPGNQRISTVEVDHEEGRQARRYDGPQQGHAVGRPRLGHGRNTSGADVEPQQEDSGKKQCQSFG